MRNNYSKRLKKTSVALVLGVSLLGGSVITYGASAYSFNKTLSLPTEEYNLSTVERKYTTNLYASIKYAYSNCEGARVAFYIKEKTTDAVVSEYLYLSGYDSSTYKKINYLSSCALRRGDMKLMAKTASSHTGYYVTGDWNPNGGL